MRIPKLIIVVPCYNEEEAQVQHRTAISGVGLA